MPHPITPVDAFTLPVVVPDNLDSAVNRGGDVEAIAQALANQTLYLRNRVDPLVADAAHKSQSNTFTQPNTFTNSVTFNGNTTFTNTNSFTNNNSFSGVNTFNHSIVSSVADPEEALYVTHQSPADAGSTWRLVGSFKANTGTSGVYRYAQLYTGSNAGDTEGQLLIGCNTVWNKTTSQWQQQYGGSGADSLALIWHRGKIRVSRIAAGSAPWTSWPTSFAMGHNAAGLGGTNEGVCVGNFQSNADIRGKNVVVTGSDPDGFKYSSTTITRTVTIPLMSGYGKAMIQEGNLLSGTGGFVQTTDATDRITWPLFVPHGATLLGVEMVIDQTSTNPCVVRLNKVQASYSPANTGMTQIENITTSPTGFKAHSIAWGGGEVMDSATTHYDVSWKPGNLNDKVKALRQTYYDPGPRNY